MATLEITCIGKDKFDRMQYIAPAGTIHRTRPVVLVDVNYDYLDHGGMSLHTVCPAEGNTYYSEPDCPISPDWEVKVVGQKKEPDERTRFNYALLDRLRCDCDYFLGCGRGNAAQLWDGDVDAQCDKMLELWDGFTEKPEWLTRERIEQYRSEMKSYRRDDGSSAR